MEIGRKFTVQSVCLVHSVKWSRNFWWKEWCLLAGNKRKWNESQFGFQSKMSCVQVTQFLRQKIVEKMTRQACFIDLKKPCDITDFQILLEKLENMFSEEKSMISWGNNFSDGEQYVSMNDLETEGFSIKTGVPQGYVLGPFPFLK